VDVLRSAFEDLDLGLDGPPKARTDRERHRDVPAGGRRHGDRWLRLAAGILTSGWDHGPGRSLRAHAPTDARDVGGTPDSATWTHP
jgi:hypothetical protein